MFLTKRISDNALKLGRYTRWLWNHYPEQVFGFALFGVTAFGCFMRMVWHVPDLGYYGPAPYYRNHYEVRRPDDPVALHWRLPEEYPAYYQTNREEERALHYYRDYGWKSKREGKV